MRMGGKASKPSFLWQGLPVLLPVAIMAIVALLAIARDRAVVEAEARQRAEEIGRELQLSLERQWAPEMNRFTALSFLAHENLDHQGRWPGNRSNADAVSTNLSTVLATWRFDYPALTLDESVPNYVDFTSDGEIRFPPEENFPPRPSPLWSNLSPPQQAAWQKLESAQATKAPAAQVENLREEFVATGPPDEVRTAAQVVSLRSRMSEMKPAEAVQAAEAFISSNHLTGQSEAGIPLAALLMNDAIQRSREIGPTKPLWDGVNFVVRLTPSFMTPRLLDGLEQIAHDDPALNRSIAAERQNWKSQNQLQKLALNIRKTRRIQGLTATNFWIQQDGDQWFCATTPVWINPTAAISNQVTAVYLYPHALVSATLQQSLKALLANIPDYVQAKIDLSGESFSAGNLTNAGPADGASLLLAQMTGKLTQIVHQGPEFAPNATLRGASSDYEAMPGNPSFNVRIFLANRDALLAQHRTRALLLDGLIIASTFAALVGFFAARRAYLHQFVLSEMKSNFVSSVSHELRAPIASVRLMAESLERGKVAGGEKQNEYYRFIVQECRRLSSLIENVLDFSRIEQGRKQYEFEPTDVLALTRETVKLMEPYAEEKGVRLETSNIEHPTPNIELEVDGRAVQQALVNLIDNAIKHSAKGQTVTVGMECGDRRTGVLAVSNPSEERVNSETGRMPVLLYVEDHGAGIPPGEHEKIFERFYRLGSELRRETQGVGIGLSIVRHIVAAHGGQVTVRSNIGEGSRFTIVLPVNRLNK